MGVSPSLILQAGVLTRNNSRGNMNFTIMLLVFSIYRGFNRQMLELRGRLEDA